MDNFTNEDRLLDLWLEEYFELHADLKDLIDFDEDLIDD
jgi:hypothetical protein